MIEGGVGVGVGVQGIGIGAEVQGVRAAFWARSTEDAHDERGWGARGSWGAKGRRGEGGVAAGKRRKAKQTDE